MISYMIKKNKKLQASIAAKIKRSSMKILSWNIQSRNNVVGSKTCDNDFITILEPNDIICLQETRQQVKIDGYGAYYSLRNNKKNGGLVTLVKNTLRAGTEKVPDVTSSEMLVIKLKKSFFETKNDIYVINTYIRPGNSKTNITTINGLDTFNELELLLNKLKSRGDIILCGDFNSRIQTKPDYIPNETRTKYLSLPMDYEPDIQTPRNSRDPNQNGYTKTFLDFTINNQLHILNGRTLGDFKGDFTCIEYNGPSVVDYFLTTMTLRKYIKYLKIGELTTLSDHKPLCMHLLISFNYIRQSTLAKSFKVAPQRFKFPNDKIKNFIRSQNRPNIKLGKTKIDETTYSQDTDGCVKFNDDVTALIQKCAEYSLEKTKPFTGRKLVHKPWFTMKCRIAKRELNKAARVLSKFPNNTFLRTRYYKIKKSFKKYIKQQKAKHFDKLNNEIEKGRILNWKQFKKLKDANKDDEKFDSYDMENFEVFFKNLYTDNHVSIPEDTKRELIDEADRKASRVNDGVIDDTALNTAITIDEINSCVRQLKNGKSSSVDLINNEIIKHLTRDNMVLVQRLFNHCFDNGTYPWNDSIITPLHKKGDKSNPDNYRAIAVSSCLGKLFSSILLNRLIEFRKAFDPDPINQLGFSKNAQTYDHLFTLYTLVSKYKKKSQSIYAVFIDFKKAFDSICRQALFFKLANSGVNGKFYSIIRYMYAHSQGYIKLCGHLSNVFPIDKGTEQGHPLSPDLFKLFLKDLSPILEIEFPNCPTLGDTIVSHLLWADDLIILALDQITLQLQLDNLYKYCDKWGIEINMDKTKLIVFNERHSFYNFKPMLGHNYIEKVESYCYLGIEVHCSGNFKMCLSQLKTKAIRALYSLQRTINKTVISYKSCCFLFDALVKPVLLYGAPIWTPSLAIFNNAFKNNATSLDGKFSNETIEIVHLKFLKWALGVHPKASNIGVWGETGRRPLIYECIRGTLNYYKRLHKLDRTTLAYKALQDQINLKLPWYIKIQNAIDLFYSSSSYHTETQSTANAANPSPFMLANAFVREPSPNDINDYVRNTPEDHYKLPIMKIIPFLQDNFVKFWEISKQNSPKLEFYNECKTRFSTEHYLTDIKNFHHRSQLTQLRISAHKLNIETGRYKNIPKENRICHWCKVCLGIDKIETEKHFFAECDFNSKIRTEMIKRVQPLLNINMNDTIKLFQSSNIEPRERGIVNNIVGKYLGRMLKNRENLLEDDPPPD